MDRFFNARSKGLLAYCAECGREMPDVGEDYCSRGCRSRAEHPAQAVKDLDGNRFDLPDCTVE